MSAFEKIAGMFPSRELGEKVARKILAEHTTELVNAATMHIGPEPTPSESLHVVPVRFTKDSVRIGQTLLLSGYYADRPKEVKVIKVGRTVLSVDLNGAEAKFDMATGRGKRDYRLRVGTVEQYEDELLRKTYIREMEKFGVEILTDREIVPTAKLEHILRVLWS